MARGRTGPVRERFPSSTRLVPLVKDLHCKLNRL